MATIKGVELPHLQAWRLWKGLKQEELAQLAEVTQSTISKIENGGEARLGTVAKLAKALGIEREQLLHEEPGKEQRGVA